MEKKFLRWQAAALFKKWLRAFLVFVFAIFSTLPQLSALLPLFQENQPQQARAQGEGNIILLWDGASSTIPAGWVCVSCGIGSSVSETATSTFFNVFPRAASSYATATSGSDITTHTLVYATETAGAAVIRQFLAGATNPQNNHVHNGISASAVEATTTVPNFQSLLFIKATSYPTVLPSGVIGMFDIASSSLNSAWSYYSTMSSEYLRGGSEVALGGSPQHDHAFIATSSVSSLAIKAGTGTSRTGAPSHSHSFSGTSLDASNSPPYITTVFAKLNLEKNLDVAANDGLIAMFDATPSAAWDVISNATSSYYQMLLIGSDAANATGGSQTHLHASSSYASSQVSAGTLKQNANSGTPYSAGTHAHNFTVYLDTSSSMPVYRDVILAKKIPLPSAPDLAQVHYRWRNNDGFEAGATFATGTDGAIASVGLKENYRLRVSIKNQGTSDAATSKFGLQYGLLTGGSCNLISSWTTIPDVMHRQFADFALVNVSNVLHGASTTDVAINGGIDNDGAIFTSGQFVSDSKFSNTILIATGSVTEMEFSLWAEATAQPSQDYCFRTLDGNSIAPLSITYSVYPQLLTAPVFVSKGGGGSGGPGFGGPPPWAQNQSGGDKKHGGIVAGVTVEGVPPPAVITTGATDMGGETGAP